jgi:nitrite reductase (NO-forming)
VLVLAYLAAGGVAALLGGRVPGGAWLSLHLVLLGAVSNAIVAWSEHFAAALLHAPPAGERAALARTLALNLGVAGVLTGVPTGRPGLVAAGAGLAGLVVLAHGLGSPPARSVPWPPAWGTRSGSTWLRPPRCSPGRG